MLTIFFSDDKYLWNVYYARHYDRHHGNNHKHYTVESMKPSPSVLPDGDCELESSLT